MAGTQALFCNALCTLPMLGNASVPAYGSANGLGFQKLGKILHVASKVEGGALWGLEKAFSVWMPVPR